MKKSNGGVYHQVTRYRHREMLDNQNLVLENLSYFATIVGALSFFLAITIFLIEAKRRRQEHELATYDTLAKEYREFLKLCLENIDLQLFLHNSYTEKNLNLSAEQKIRKYILFEILTSLLESAFFQYRNHNNRFKKAQWTGWVQYTRDWCERKDFQKAWEEHLSSEFDSDFLNFMNDQLQDVLNEQDKKRKSQIKINQ
ncbi:MAG: hypothetical protein WA913_10545 [Pricia sp.]